MTLTSGTKLGPYEIQSSLGAGGMGEVYRARDTRLERTVAIKTLPAQFSSDPIRKQRFEREAKTISSLNHPHICVLHDIGRQEGMDYIVMECVEGQTLAKRLEKGPLSLDQVLEFGSQIADALDKAHRLGLVHRDLKPGNIMLTATGAKLLDFGLAKPSTPRASAATLTAATPSPLTEHGTIIGTFQYMSPEQIDGKEVDGRSDIFSLGAVLYEMVTSRRAFEGKSQLSVASAIVEKQPPPLRDVQPLAPPGLEHIVKTCLMKDPDQRWQSAADLKRELEWVAEISVRFVAAHAPAIRATKALRIYAGLATIAALTFAGLMWQYSVRSRVAPPVVRFALTPPPTEPLAVTSDLALALSPDVRRIAFVVHHGDTTQLFVRETAAFEGRLLPGTEGAADPFFSPDGEWLGFYADGQLKKIPVSGGSSIVLCNAPEGKGATWLPDGTIIFNADWREGLRRVSAAGGASEVLTVPDVQRGETYHWWPDAVPGSSAVLFTDQKGPSSDEASVAVLSLKTREWRTLIEKGSNPRYLPSGHIVYQRNGALLAAPFDKEKLTVTGPSFPVAGGVLVARVLVAPDFGIAQFAVSRDGSLAYVPGAATRLQNALVVVDRSGGERSLTAIRRPYEDLTLSPDGRFLALTIMSDLWNVWLYDLERGTLSRLTFEGDNRDPIWTSDGKRVIYVSFRNGRFHLFWKPIDGTGPEESLVTTDTQPWPYSCSPDGRWLSYEVANKVYVLPLMGERQPKAILSADFASGGAISPDGKWIAYESNESGQSEVYVQSFLSGVGKWQISTNGGIRPRWSVDGRELFFRSGTNGSSGSNLMSVSIRTDPGFAVGTPAPLFMFRYAQAGHTYAVMPDGKHFICIKEPEQEAASTQVDVVLNWASELARK